MATEEQKAADEIRAKALSSVVSSLKAPFERAFSGSGADSDFLYALKERDNLKPAYRWAFEEPGSKMSLTHSWHHQFDDLFDICYGDRHPEKALAGAVWETVETSLTEWVKKTKEVDSLRLGVANASNLKGNPIDVQQRVLSLFETGTKLAKDMRGHIVTFEAAHTSLRNCTNSLSSAVNTLNNSWVDFAKEVSKDQGSAIPVHDKDWVHHLHYWSSLTDMGDHSLLLCKRTLERLEALCLHTAQLSDLLRQLPPLCLDLYSTLLAGGPVGLLDYDMPLRNFGDKLRDWNDRCPTWASNEVYHKVRSGQVHYRPDGKRSHWGNDPNSANVSREEDIQVGITRFDFGCDRSVGTRLDVGNAQNANRVWLPRGDVRFYGSHLSWIQVPDKVRERGVHFSWTTFDMEGLKNGLYWERAFVPGMDEQTPSTGSDNNYNQIKYWIVMLPRPFNSDNVAVRPWIMDMCVAGGISLAVDEISRDKFRILVTVPYSARLWFLRIGYVAYEKTSSIDGFHNELYHLDVPRREQAQPVSHKYKPVYFPFPEGKFNRRPAVAAMMSMFWINRAWNYRADVRYAASRHGVVIQAASWSDTIITDLKFEILAIANE